MAIVKTDYHQPEFYHFNSDSIALVDYIKENYSNKRIDTLLDYCSGVGVIALELSNHFEIQEIIFLDVQNEYEEFIEKNIELLNFSNKSSFLNNYDVLKAMNKQVEMIVINPPYFLETASRLPESDKRRIARFYKKGELELIIKNALSLCDKGTKLFMCIKLDEHNQEELKFLEELKNVGMKVTTLKKLSIFELTLTEDKLI